MKNMNRVLRYGGAAGSAVASSAASAAIPATELTAAVGEITTDVGALNTAIWPLVALVTASLIGIGLFKKFVSKGAS